MPTFGTLRTALRNEILQEASTAFFSDTQLLTFLSDASVELAAAASIPRVTYTTPAQLPVGAITVALPAGVSSVDRVVLTDYGLELSAAPYSAIRFFQALTGIPRHFYVDLSASTPQLLIAPALALASSASFSYVHDLSVEVYAQTDTPWDSTMGEWHDLIKIYAGVKAFEMSMEYGAQAGEKPQYWVGRLRERLLEFGSFLGSTDVERALLLEHARPYVRTTMPALGAS